LSPGTGNQTFKYIAETEKPRAMTGVATVQPRLPGTTVLLVAYSVFDYIIASDGGAFAAGEPRSIIARRNSTYEQYILEDSVERDKEVFMAGLACISTIATPERAYTFVCGQLGTFKEVEANHLINKRPLTRNHSTRTPCS
jgi:hypothetical protein